MPGVIKRILGNVFLFPFEIQNKKAPHFFPSSQPRHTSAVQRCLFAYPLADTVKNNLGIVTDVIRKMIKQDSFFCDAHSLTLSHAVWSNTDTIGQFPIRVKILLQGVAANDDFRAQQ